MTIQRNMAGWHRWLYAAGGAAAIGWSWASGSHSWGLYAVGALGIAEALAGV